MRLRHGWTLHEMIISLGVMAGVVALAVHVAVGQLRFFRGIGEIAALRGQLGQAAGIAANALREASAPGGDIVAALDSAVELRMTVGTAVVCWSSPGRVTVPAPAADGNTMAAFFDAPQPGDIVVALLEDSLSATWLTFHVASPPAVGGACQLFLAAATPWTFDVREQLTIPVGTVLRLVRPLRLSLYRASDNRWYLGARDWNAAAEKLNTIQPVAGPLDPYSEMASKTGLRFTYFDGSGAELSDAFDPRRIAGVGIAARGRSLRPVRVGGMGNAEAGYADSAVVFVALRNPR